MIVYLDMAFLLNSGSDALALYITARLAGIPVCWKKLLTAAFLGGIYGALCQMPAFLWLSSLPFQLLIAAGLVWLTFHRRAMFLRLALLFLFLSCMLGGAFIAAAQLLQTANGFDLRHTLNWRVFFLTGAVCYLLLSIVFRSSARHTVAQELCQVVIERSGRRTEVSALLDSGHTLTDSVTGAPVLIVYWDALEPLWEEEEKIILAKVGEKGAAWCMEKLPNKKFWLIPYQSVGVSGGLLLCFRADKAWIGGEEVYPLTVALSPTAVSDGGGYTALWGAGQKGADVHAA